MLEVGNSFTFGYEGDNIMGLAEHHHLFNGALNSLKKLARARGRNTLQKTNVSNEANINTIGKGGGGGVLGVRRAMVEVQAVRSL